MDHTSRPGLTAYKLKEMVPLSMETFNKEKAKLLNEKTLKLLNDRKSL